MIDRILRRLDESGLIDTLAKTYPAKWVSVQRMMMT